MSKLRRGGFRRSPAPLGSHPLCLPHPEGREGDRRAGRSGSRADPEPERERGGPTLRLSRLLPRPSPPPGGPAPRRRVRSLSISRPRGRSRRRPRLPRARPPGTTRLPRSQRAGFSPPRRAPAAVPGRAGAARRAPGRGAPLPRRTSAPAAAAALNFGAQWDGGGGRGAPRPAGEHANVPPGTGGPGSGRAPPTPPASERRSPPGPGRPPGLRRGPPHRLRAAPVPPAPAAAGGDAAAPERVRQERRPSALGVVSAAPPRLPPLPGPGSPCPCSGPQVCSRRRGLSIPLPHFTDEETEARSGSLQSPATGKGPCQRWHQRRLDATAQGVVIDLPPRPQPPPGTPGSSLLPGPFPSLLPVHALLLCRPQLMTSAQVTEKMETLHALRSGSGALSRCPVIIPGTNEPEETPHQHGAWPATPHPLPWSSRFHP